jgi:hypothetical protein
VLEKSGVILEKLLLFAGLAHSQTADGITGDAVPEVNGVGKVVALFVAVVEEGPETG